MAYINVIHTKHILNYCNTQNVRLYNEGNTNDYFMNLLCCVCAPLRRFQESTEIVVINKTKIEIVHKDEQGMKV